MTKRKSLSKKTRFEVFKRDSFTCQYCGQKAPDVILELDHIKPVSKGGDNSEMNLTTSCFVCNRGKSDRELSDDSVITKQRKQIEELNIRRQQLEMMLEWRDALIKDDEFEYNKGIKYFNEKYQDVRLNDNGEEIVKKLVKKFGIIKILDTIDLSYNKYTYDENTEKENFEIVLSKLGGILNLIDKPEHIRKMAFIKGIIRNRFHYFDSQKVSILLKKYYNQGYCLDDLISEAKISRNWSTFINTLEELT